MLNVYTAQFRYPGADRLDITVKSGEQAFAPSWDMVKGIKDGSLGAFAYERQYYALMRKSFVQNQNKWMNLFKCDKIVLVCYCPSGTFCHRYILAELLEKIGKAKYCGEILYANKQWILPQ